MWVSLVKFFNIYVLNFGTTKLALLITRNTFLQKIIKWILNRFWSKKIEPELDKKAFKEDQKPLEKEVVNTDKKVYDEAKKELDRDKKISEETRQKLIKQDIDFLNGGRR